MTYGIVGGPSLPQRNAGQRAVPIATAKSHACQRLGTARCQGRSTGLREGEPNTTSQTSTETSPPESRTA
jgi:hypothetical protein